jgi:AraC-like DNA-binding protein
VTMDTPIIFQDQEYVYSVDTCEPLKAAARQGELSLHAWSRGGYPGQRLSRRAPAEVRSVGVWDAPTPQSWGLERHCNEGIEFTYLAGGQVGFTVDGRSWSLKPGHLTITRPWQFHQVGMPHVSPSRLYWLILDVNVRRPNEQWRWPEWLVNSKAELKLLTELLSQNEHPVWPASAEVASSFTKLAELVETKGSDGNETRLKLYINELLVAVLDTLRQERVPLDVSLTTSQRTVELFLESLASRSGYDWDLNSMARQCGLSRSQFATYCKQLTNMTPIEYLTHCRVEAAARLLRERPELTITDAAFACGFNSSQYFATVFNAVKGCSPRQFRQQQ